MLDSTESAAAPMPIDFSARYSVAGYDGIAFYLRGHAVESIAELDEYGDCIGGYDAEDTGFVRAVMIGDDREHIVDIDDLTMIGDDDYCSQCGQIGCTHDGR